jgi:hypothetical protein
MANLNYVKENRITQELDEEVSSRRKLILCLGVPIALVCTFVMPGAGWLTFVLVAVIYASAGGRDAIRETGALGEDYTLSVLSSLPDSYTIFNQVDVPDERSRTGKRELDFIVCGPNGVFVIESKNHKGSVTGNERDDKWTVHKVGRGGTPYISSVRNPVRQVKSQVFVLNKFLQSKKLNPWITGIVSFSSNNDTSGIESTVPITGSAALAEFVKEFKGRREIQDFDRIVESISELAA